LETIMPIPDYQDFMLPLLKAISDGKERPIRDVTWELADQVGLSQEERQQLLPSGQQSVVANRVGWAKTYLKKAGLVDSPKRGIVRITQDGLKVLADNPTLIDNQFLKKYASFLGFYGKSDSQEEAAEQPVEKAKTPDEVLESSYQSLRDALADEILDQVKTCSPEFFERLVVDLLVAMGYGGTLADAGQAIGKTGDGGIDGIIKEDRLGLDVVCIQAKRWENTVGRPVVQAFAGSMEGMRARKGVLITTSSFSKDADEYVGRIERKIVLIDGRRLAQLMIDHGIGVTTARTYTIKKLDLDYFVEDEG
jgi:restriction system protein